jgi:hypothetical protein
VEEGELMTDRILSFRVKMTPKRPSEEMQKFVSLFESQLQVVHRSAVMKILETVSSWSRVDTGRFRSGWWAYMNAFGHPYRRSLTDKGKNDNQAEAEGMAMGRFQESQLRTIVENGVIYGPYVEDSVGVFDIEGATASVPSPYPDLMSATPKFIEMYSNCMNKFFDNAVTAYNEKKKLEPITDFGPPMATE